MIYIHEYGLSETCRLGLLVGLYVRGKTGLGPTYKTLLGRDHLGDIEIDVKILLK
jgi:hypothetical protein